MASVLLPVFLLAGLGWVMGRLARIPSRPLAQVAFWVLSPALIFESLRTADLPAMGTVVVFALLHQLVMFGLSLGVRRVLFPEDRDARAVASLSLTFGNCGNLGLPLLLFAYGPPGVEVGAVFLATNTVLLATLGVAVASGDGSRKPWWAYGLPLLRVPWAYAVVAALLSRWIGLPDPLSRASSLLAQGAIPLFLLLLGLELASVRAGEVLRPAAALAFLRLVVGGLVAWGLAAALCTEGVVRGSLMVQGSVPTAVNAFLLASQYGRRQDLAASVLLLSTLFSLGTLSLLLFLLGGAG